MSEDTPHEIPRQWGDAYDNQPPDSIWTALRDIRRQQLWEGWHAEPSTKDATGREEEEK